MKIFAVGGSMRPFIRSRSILSLEFRVESLEKGDVVLYRKGSKFFVHRIIGKSGNGKLKIEDDAGIVGRHSIREDEILGKIVFPWYLEGRTGLFLSGISRKIFKIGRKIKKFF